MTKPLNEVLVVTILTSLGVAFLLFFLFVRRLLFFAIYKNRSVLKSTPLIKKITLILLMIPTAFIILSSIRIGWRVLLIPPAPGEDNFGFFMPFGIMFATVGIFVTVICATITILYIRRLRRNHKTES